MPAGSLPDRHPATPSTSVHGPGHLLRRCRWSASSLLLVLPQVLHRADRRLGDPATSACSFAGWAMTDPNFRAIITKPDNVPIVHADLLGRLLHLAGAVPRPCINDERIARGEPLLEKLDDEKVLVWPDLVYTELICMIICTVVLIVWAVAAQGAAGAAGHQRQGAQPVEGAVVLPRPAGNARLLRSVDGRRRAADHDHRRPDRHALHRLQPARATATTPSPSASSPITIVPVRLPGAVGDADRAGHVPARAELELLRPVRVLGPAQGRAAQQRQPVATSSGCSWARHQPMEGMAWFVRELPGIMLVLAYLFAAAAAAGQDGDAPVLRQDGLRPLHHAGDADSVHGRAAHQDGAALDAST